MPEGQTGAKSGHCDYYADTVSKRDAETTKT